MGFILKYINSIFVKVLGVIGILLSVVSYGYWKGKRKAKQEKQAEEIEEMKVVIDTMKKNNDKEKEIAENIEKIDEQVKQVIREEVKKDTYDLGKWLIIICFSFYISGCTKTVTQYIPTNDCPRLQILPHPELKQAIIRRGQVLDNETFEAIVHNDKALKGLIIKYEEMIKTYNKEEK